MTTAAGGSTDDVRRLNLILSCGVMLALLALRLLQGEISVNGGFGYDGQDYARGLVEGVQRDKANIALRPLVLWVNQPLYRLTGNVIETFRMMNLLYAGLLAWALCSLFDRYSDSRTGKILLLGNLALCIATLQMPAYYPVLIDLGAMAVTALAVVAIVRERRGASALLLSLAVLAREFSVACLLFGLARDVRRRVPLVKIIGTYAPAVATLVALRYYVAHYFTRRPLSPTQLLGNISFWLDPVFVVVFLYFLLTVFGGISLFLASSPRRIADLWRQEWEWAVFALSVVGAAALGDADIWRYLAYALPVAATGFAVSWPDQRPRALAAGATLTLATLVTQRPFRVMSLDSYFIDWFPMYVHAGKAPLGHPASMWPTWTWRLAAGAALLCAMIVVARLSARGRQNTD